MHDDAALARYARELAAFAASTEASEVDTLASITAVLAARAGIDVVFAFEHAVIDAGPCTEGRVVPEVPAGVAAALVLATAREALLGATTRRRHGAHYTPYRVARRLSALALDRLPLSTATTACDPAVGGGIFLIALADELEARGFDRADVVARLWGADIDPVSVAVARTALRLWAGSPALDGIDDRIVVGDSLVCGAAVWPTPHDDFGLVIGNPPFLNQLQRASARTRADAAQLIVRFGDASRGYVDTSALFMLSALDLAAVDGLVLLIQPQSCLSARDSEGVRRAIDERATLEGLWFARDRIFDASVRVCAPLIRRAARERASVLRWVDRDVAPVAPAPRSAADGGEWSSLIRDLLGVPPLALSHNETLADIGCRATSGFRDQFYGFVDATHERADRPDATMRLVTVGMIDPLTLRWGRRNSRFARRDFSAPVVDIDELEPSVRAWAEARRGSKILIATQTKVIEVAVDEVGDCVPLTPVIDLRAPDGALWRVAAALTNPVATAVACAVGAGSALAVDAIKLSAKQVLALPVPIDRALWDRGAELVQTLSTQTGDRVALFRHLAETMCAAYGQPSEPLTTWWLARLPKVP